MLRKIAFTLLLLAPAATAAVPTYRVNVIATYTTTTTLTGASEAGHLCGYQVNNGVILPYVATVDTGLTTLPLPVGYISGAALDVNSHGVVVGTVADNGFPYDLGEPAIWTPDGNGGYAVTIPQQFTTMPGPLGNMSINGGQIVAINDAGTMVGWSRYQGFQGGPTTQFFTGAAPLDLKALGFEATVRDINENNVICGDGLRFDLATNTATALGVPAPVNTVSFNFVIAYAINDLNEVVAAAHRATSLPEWWLTYLHDGAGNWRPLNPSATPLRFVGFYDNNNRGDVAATGGVFFADENLLIASFNSLLDPADAHWTVDLGYIGNDRRVATTAENTSTGEFALVLLTPIATDCPGDYNGDNAIDFADFSTLVAGWGGPAGDLTGDNMTDFADFAIIVANWGPCN